MLTGGTFPTTFGPITGLIGYVFAVLGAYFILTQPPSGYRNRGSYQATLPRGRHFGRAALPTLVERPFNRRLDAPKLSQPPIRTPLQDTYSEASSIQTEPNLGYLEPKGKYQSVYLPSQVVQHDRPLYHKAAYD